jgi:phosphoglycerol transferase
MTMTTKPAPATDTPARTSPSIEPPARASRALPWLLAAALAAVFAWLVARSHGLNPTIFADEWYYSKMARLQPLDQAIVPSYLYLWLFGASARCGDGFLDCVRAGNALLYVAGSPFLYLVARQVASRTMAAVLALLAALAPLNAYTGYFMPESTYYLGFCVLSWIALAGRAWPRMLQALAAGLVLGAMSLVKVHALFLLPTLCLYLFYLAWADGGAWLRNGFIAVAIAALAALGIKFGLGFLLAGKAGLSLFGPFYGANAQSASGQSVLRLLNPMFINARGHLMALALLDALPLAVLVHGLLRGEARGAAGALRVWTLLTLAAAAGMTILYTATVAGVNNEGLRLHLRYYSFVLPLLWMVAAADAAPPPGRTGALAAFTRWAPALLLAAILGIAWIKLPTYAINPADTPEIAGTNFDPSLFMGIALLQGAIVLLWAANVRSAKALFLLVALPVTIICGAVAQGVFLHNYSIMQIGDKAGHFAHGYLPPAERASIVVAGTDMQQLMRAQFQIDHPDSEVLELPGDAALETYQLPVRHRWLLVFGRHPLPANVTPVAQTADYALVKLDNPRRVLGHASLAEAFGPGLIASAEGLSHIEDFGRWSDARNVVLHLNQVLPRKVKVLIKAMPYADNNALPFVLRIGAASTRFRLNGGMQEIGLDLDTDGAQRDIVIEVPHPVSPAEYGNPADGRKLGIALGEIEISTPAD